ncbi:putative phage tail component-like protein [Priestia megaterium]|uniref:distal tail protein Dit n=1 Tax=Priestia megaterium TaxID=1404 RepID=UPI00339A919C
MSFMFKGISSENYLEVGRIKRSLLPPITRNTVKIPGRPGEIHQNTEIGMRKWEIPIRIKEENAFSLNEAIRVISEWLYSDKPEQFILTKDPSIYYNAYLEGETDLEEIIRVGKGTINFIAPDPYGFNRVETVVPLVNEYTNMKIDGTYKTFPYMKFTVKKNITYLSYMGPNDNDMVVLGRPVEVDTQTAAPKEELVLDDDMDSITGNSWAAGGTIVDGGIVAGEMAATNGYFTYNSIGEGSQWHGPAVKKGLPEPLDHWKVYCWLTFDATKSIDMIARAELYFMDVNGSVIGKMALKDMYRDAKNTMVEFRAGPLNGGQYLVQSTGAKPGVFNNFWGLLSIKQEDRFYECYITKIVNGVHTTRLFKRWYDVKNLYHVPKLAQIQLHVAGTGTSKVPSPDRLNFNRLQVFKINKLNAATQVPYIAKAGDVIEVDHYTKQILVNGEPRKDILDPISKLFAIEGNTGVSIYPKDAVTAELSYKSRWQ